MKKTTEVFSVRRVQLKANGHTYWQWKADGRINGVRYRKHFANRDEAEGYRCEMEIKALNDANVVRTTASHLSPEQLRDAEAALGQLNGRYSLMFAVEWLLQTYRDTLTEKSFTDAYPLFLAERERHVRDSTIADYRSSFEKFEGSYGSKKLPEITAEDVTVFLGSRGLTGKSWNNTRADLNAVFEWSMKAPRKWIVANPVHDVEKFDVTMKLPEILAAKKVAELFNFLEAYSGNTKVPLQPGCLVPYFALAVFAGIRPAINAGELVRIANLPSRERIIDLQMGVIRITPEIAKTNGVRQIVIQPNLLAWLKRYPLDRFPLLPRNAIDLIGEVRAKFSLGHDVLRHTFISMHVAKFKSMGDAALQAGNSEAMIKKHYLNLVTTAEAKEFWKIAPSR